MTGWEMFGLHGLGGIDLLRLSLHFLMLSLLSVGGALASAPDMQNFLVLTQGWLSADQFAASVAIGQAAPGPNALFVALLGWNVAGLAGMAITLVSLMLPSSILALLVGRYRRRRGDSPSMRAITAGLTPLSLGLFLSTGWVLLGATRAGWGAIALAAATVAVLYRWKGVVLPLIALGAVLGMLGLV
jgi:chromate transporter